MTKATVLVAAAVCVAIAVAVVATEPTPPFSFYDYLLGEWDVSRGVMSVASGEQSVETVVRGHYKFEKENGTLNLIGRYFDNDTATGELTNDLAVLVEFNTPTQGVFRVGSSEESLSALFTFDFQQHGNGVALSYGPWTAGAAKAVHSQFVVAAWDRFVITLFPDTAAPAATKEEDGAQARVYLGKKIPVVLEKSFFQKYGTILMIGGFFIFNFFVQQKAKGWQQQQMQQQRRRTTQTANVASLKKAAGDGLSTDNSTATAAGAGAASPTTPARTSATVEELPAGEESTSTAAPASASAAASAAASASPTADAPAAPAARKRSKKA